MTANKVLIALLNAGPFLSQQTEELLVFPVKLAGRFQDVPESSCMPPRRKSPFQPFLAFCVT